MEGDACAHSPTNLNPPIKPVLKNKNSYRWLVPTYFSFPKVSNASMEHYLLFLNFGALASLQASTPFPAVIDQFLPLNWSMTTISIPQKKPLLIKFALEDVAYQLLQDIREG